MTSTALPPPLPRTRGPLVRFFVGLWDAMNFTRRLIFNLLFFFLLFLLLLAFMGALVGGAKGGAKLADNTTLVLSLEGTLVEQDSRDALTRALSDARGDKGSGQVQLRDVLAVVDAAAKEKKITQVLLEVDDLRVGGHAALREVAEAVQRLRAAGKRVVVASKGLGQNQYYLAAQADSIYLDPDGYGVTLEGLASYRPYFREGLQDKLGVDFHLFKVGEYKSAAEPFVRDSASPEAKEANLYWMNDIWQRYLAEIATRRKLDAGTLAQHIDNMASELEAAQGDLNALALNAKWVDGLKTREEVEKLLAETGAADAQAEGGFRRVEFREYLARIAPKLPPELDSRSQVAVVVAEGEIVPGEQPRGVVGGESVARLLRQARENERVKTVVLRVNSPGGEVFASEQIRREVAALKAAGKPVVVSMGDVAASGGYWISMNADRIYADASTVTGSIGIFGLVPNFSRALDKLGVHTDGVGTTRLAGSFDPTLPLNPEAGRVIQAVIDKGYRDFTGKVAAARGKPVQDVDAAARGRVWSGAQAKERGLVDELGGLQQAIADAAKRAGLEEGKYGVHYVEEALTPFQSMLGSLAQSRSGLAVLGESRILQGLFGRAAPQRVAPLRYVESQQQQPDGPWVRAAAHCFCQP